MVLRDSVTKPLLSAMQFRNAESPSVGSLRFRYGIVSLEEWNGTGALRGLFLRIAEPLIVGAPSKERILVELGVAYLNAKVEFPVDVVHETNEPSRGFWRDVDRFYQ